MTDRQNVSPQLILSLKPIGAAGARVFARALRQKAPEHVQNQTIAPIDIRFDIPPKDPKRGHTFGSDKNSDYVLGEGNEGFSACTFRIQYIKVGTFSKSPALFDIHQQDVVPVQMISIKGTVCDNVLTDLLSRKVN